MASTATSIRTPPPPVSRSSRKTMMAAGAQETDDAFVEQLVAKLRGDTKQSNFMRSYNDAKSPTKFDLALLRHWPAQEVVESLTGASVETDLATVVMRTLLDEGEIALKINAKPPGRSTAAQQAARQLDALAQRCKAERKDFGVDLLRLGFPQVECYDEKLQRTYLCPLVLWKVRLDVVNGRFVLKREFSEPFELNDALCQFLATEAEIELKDTRLFDTKDAINDVDLENLVARISPGMGKAVASTRDEIIDALRRVQDPMDKDLPEALPTAPKSARARPTKATAGAGSGKKGKQTAGHTPVVLRIVWAAVLALFKTGNNAILKDLRVYQRQGKLSLQPEPVLSGAPGSVDILHGGFALDPSQFEAVRQLAMSRNLVINGPPGTGKSQTLASVISCAGVNSLRVLVVCEKTTALEILQRKLSELRWNNWTGDKFTAFITSVQDREALVTRARANRVDVDAIPMESFLHEEKLLLRDIRRLEKIIAAEEHKFSRHCEINNEVVSFNMTVKEAIAFVIQRKLNGAKLLVPPADATFVERVFGQDHIMRLDRCQENLPSDLVRALSFLSFSCLDMEIFDADVIASRAADLIARLTAFLEDREAIVQAAKADYVKELGDVVELWENHLEELKSIEKNISQIPDDAIQRADSPAWADAIFFWRRSSDQTRLRYFGSALARIEEAIRRQDVQSQEPNNPRPEGLMASAAAVASAAAAAATGGVPSRASAAQSRSQPLGQATRSGSSTSTSTSNTNTNNKKKNNSSTTNGTSKAKRGLTFPTNFTLSNIPRIVAWCEKHHQKHLKALQEVESKQPARAWEELPEVRSKYLAKFRAMKEDMKEVIRKSPFCTQPALEALLTCIDLPGKKDALWAVEKALAPFRSENVGRWRQSSDSIDSLLELGIVQHESFFVEFLDASKADRLSWGTRIKLCVLAHEVEKKCRGLITSDFVLDQLNDALIAIQQKVQMLFCLRQGKAMAKSIEAFEARGRQRFEQFYNRRGKNIQVNSLRELVGDIDLFCGCFPIIFCTPAVASTLFKGRHRLFDLVIFDEASQSLPHDSYASLLKGRKVIIAGDNKQMPPTTLFSAGGDLDYESLENRPLANDEDDEDIDPSVPTSAASKTQDLRSRLNAANAESLLDYAKEHSFSFRSVDLNFHYRSLNPDLMKFHCAAIYPTMALCPERPAAVSSGPAIELTHAAGVYKDQHNDKEASLITQMLRGIIQNPDQTIAVATFNEVQKKHILKVIKHHPDVVFVQQLRTLQNKGKFFVKNLENLQGDEVDTLIIGTTFGPNAQGTFDKRFGRIAFTGVGYRYLNVLFSRAKKKVHIVTSIPEVEFLSPARELDEGGALSGKSMLFGYLSYARAISTGDADRVSTVLKEFAVDESLLQDASGSLNSSLETVVFDALTRKNQFRTTRVDRVTDPNTLLQGILVRLSNLRTLVIQCNSYDSYRELIYRKFMLEKLGYDFFQVWPANWLDNPEREFERLRGVIANVQRKPRLTPIEDDLPVTVESGPGHPGTAASAQFGVSSVQEESVRRPARDLESPVPSIVSSPSQLSSEVQSIVSDTEVKVKFREHYLVKYGSKRKYIVFCPERYLRGSTTMLMGSWGGKHEAKQVKIDKARLIALSKTVPPLETFYDDIEHDKAKHYAADKAAAAEAAMSDSDADFVDAVSSHEPEADQMNDDTPTTAAAAAATPTTASTQKTRAPKTRRKRGSNSTSDALASESQGSGVLGTTANANTDATDGTEGNNVRDGDDDDDDDFSVGDAEEDSDDEDAWSPSRKRRASGGSRASRSNTRKKSPASAGGAGGKAKRQRRSR